MKWVFLLIFILLLPLVTADGGFFPPDISHMDIQEPEQKAIIFFNENNEKLVLSASYEGSVDEFGWVVPVPQVPDINIGDESIFLVMHYATKPYVEEAPRVNIFGGGLFAGAKLEQGIDIISSEQVGIYNATTISSDDPGALAKWLKENGYRVPEGAEDIFLKYNKKGWYYVAIKINLSPFKDSLFIALKNRGYDIDTVEEAVTPISSEITEAITSDGKIWYNYVPIINEIRFDADENSDNKVISKDAYWFLYYNYHGEKERIVVFENDLREFLSDGLKKEAYGSVPICADAKLQYMDPICEWYYSSSDEEYQVLLNHDCGKYCNVLEKDPVYYKELATVAAYMSINGVKEVQEQFGMTEDKLVKKSWESEENHFSSVERMIEQNLEDRLTRETVYLPFLEKYKGLTGIDIQCEDYIAGEGGLSYFFRDKIIKDIDGNVSYGGSIASKITFFDEGIYNNYLSKYHGNHDKDLVRSYVEQRVSESLNNYWTGSSEEAVQDNLNNGTIQPLILEFVSEKPVYPLEISSLNPGSTEVLLYVVSDNKMQIENFDGFDMEYAGWIEPLDLTNYYYRHDITPKQHLEINKYITEKQFVTKFRADLEPSDMKSDVIFSEAPSNEEYVMKIKSDTYTEDFIIFVIGTIFLGAFEWGFFVVMGLLVMVLLNRFYRNEPFRSNVRRTLLIAGIITLLDILYHMNILMVLFPSFRDGTMTIISFLISFAIEYVALNLLMGWIIKRKESDAAGA